MQNNLNLISAYPMVGWSPGKPGVLPAVFGETKVNRYRRFESPPLRQPVLADRDFEGQFPDCAAILRINSRQRVPETTGRQLLRREFCDILSVAK